MAEVSLRASTVYRGFLLFLKALGFSVLPDVMRSPKPFLWEKA